MIACSQTGTRSGRLRIHARDAVAVGVDEAITEGRWRRKQLRGGRDVQGKRDGRRNQRDGAFPRLHAYEFLHYRAEPVRGAALQPVGMLDGSSL